MPENQLKYPPKQEISPPTEVEFRQCGFTKNAINYPLSEAAFRWVCKFNGLTTFQAPRAWRYAPNEAARGSLEAKAREAKANEQDANSAQTQEAPDNQGKVEKHPPEQGGEDRLRAS